MKQIKHAGYDWMDMRHIFVTRKHIDYLLGIVWMVRMICRFMDHGEYKGEAFCLYSQTNIFDSYEKHHSTVKDACEPADLAKENIDPVQSYLALHFLCTIQNFP